MTLPSRSVCKYAGFSLKPLNLAKSVYGPILKIVLMLMGVMSLLKF